VRHL
jgi:hypothetical protein